MVMGMVKNQVYFWSSLKFTIHHPPTTRHQVGVVQSTINQEVFPSKVNV